MTGEWHRAGWIDELDRRRIALGLGAGTWASVANVALGTVQKILKGETRSPTVEIVSRLAAVLDVTVVLAGGEVYLYDADRVVIIPEEDE